MFRRLHYVPNNDIISLLLSYTHTNVKDTQRKKNINTLLYLTRKKRSLSLPLSFLTTQRDEQTYISPSNEFSILRIIRTLL